MAIQSFKRNQNLIDHLNSLIIYCKLRQLDKMDYNHLNSEQAEASRELIKKFIHKLLMYVNSNKGKGMLGVDSRLRTFVRRFEEAKGRKHQFTSKLFKDSPEQVIDILDNLNSSEGLDALIISLTELRTIVQSHISGDLKELIKGL